MLAPITEGETVDRFIELKAKSCAPYAKGWQINAIIDGVESEQTEYGVSRAQALENARKTIKLLGRLMHEPYKGATK